MVLIASMDTPPGADSCASDGFRRRQPTISWPEVGPEPCRQLDDNADDAALNRVVRAHGGPSGNRINDTLRAALTSGGDFFSATSPAGLKVIAASSVCGDWFGHAAGTSPVLSSSTVGAGNLVIQSGFITNMWDGYITRYDQVADARLS